MSAWNNSHDKVPGHNEKVLVKQGEYIDIAFFDASSRKFMLRCGVEYNLTEDVNWLRLPGQKGGLLSRNFLSGAALAKSGSFGF